MLHIGFSLILGKWLALSGGRYRRGRERHWLVARDRLVARVRGRTGTVTGRFHAPGPHGGRAPVAHSLAGATLLAMLAGCSGADNPTQGPTATALAAATAAAAGSATAAAAPSATFTASPTSTPEPSPTTTPDEYTEYSVDYLAERAYGGPGSLEIVDTLAVTDAFTRTLVNYPSDGLNIAGFMNTPAGPGPFPVVIVIHGYVDPSVWRTVTYTARYADALAREGFLVVHPNLRGHPPSDDGPDRYRVGHAIDVLNLIAEVKESAGQPGPLQRAIPEIHLFGHSMGGGISLRVITVSDDVESAFLYGAMSGDERRNYERIQMWSGGERGAEELQTPDEALARISPIAHLDEIDARVSIHHGTLDDQVPPEWSTELCALLTNLGKEVECFDYEGEPHTFTAAGERQLMERAIQQIGSFATSAGSPDPP